MHVTVLLQEAVDHLLRDENGFYVDATFGRGGHSAEILKRLGPQGRLLVIDKDSQALEVARRIAVNDARVSLQQGSFAHIDEYLDQHAARGDGVQGILLDLGVSSPQLDEAERGFSFLRDGPLDMRMDTARGQTAAQWLASAEMYEIARVLKVYGEERFARRIAQQIVNTRAEQPLHTTQQLAALIDAAVPVKDRHKHPATRSFQAIRIHINQELEELEAFLNKVIDVLAVGGRLVVISFHSLEDRMVKRFIRAQEQGAPVPSYIPLTTQQGWQPRLKGVGKAVRPAAAEVDANPRARSAIMRVAERVA